jgi:uncharacterized protein
VDKRFEEIKEIVKKELSSSAHDLDHTFRVLQNAKLIASKMDNVDLEVLELAALLHDIARMREDTDKTGKTDHALLGAEMASNILRRFGYPEETIEKVADSIRSHRFRTDRTPKFLEGKILFDADKLDAIGAIGIARAYMIAGQMGERLYAKADDIESYKKQNLVGGKSTGRIKDISKHSVNIEYETKFKKIPERLFTEVAKQIAYERLEFMKKFFAQLESEIRGEA